MHRRITRKTIRTRHYENNQAAEKAHRTTPFALTTASSSPIVPFSQTVQTTCFQRKSMTIFVNVTNFPTPISKRVHCFSLFAHRHSCIGTFPKSGILSGL
jgi:hypothetical protein